MNSIPRPEFPNPQFERSDWLNLNGEWEFEFDYGMSGYEQNYMTCGHFSEKINVPFSFESPLSGINKKDFCECVWYRRTFELPDNWTFGGTLLRFGAADYHTQVYINGKECGIHRGGMTSFAFDISPFIHAGENTVVVRIADNLRSGKQPAGKQCLEFNSTSVFYTRTTGIWQTVWLEHIGADVYIKSLRIVTDIYNSKASVTVKLSSHAPNSVLKASAVFDGREIASSGVKVNGGWTVFDLNIDEKDLHLWTVGQGNLYDLELVLNTENGFDRVKSYFGMRDVSYTETAMLINGEPVFQRLVLDQGYYPEGTWTAPTDDALKSDIILSMDAGFNGARLHQKIFEPRFLYWADKMGYIVWGEHGNWGMDYSGESYENFLTEWIEAVERDFNHPSIVGWCPLNETGKHQKNDSVSCIYRTTKTIDPTRPVIDTSGWIHVETDIFDVHDYDQNPESFRKRYEPLMTYNRDTESDDEIRSKFYTNEDIAMSGDYTRMPYFISEMGGTNWNLKHKDEASWGYGNSPEDIEEFYKRFEGLISAMLGNSRICAYCYTQLTDVEQEQNGIYYYDRTLKFDMKRLRDIQTKKAAAEK